jgi:hypothetical protein
MKQIVEKKELDEKLEGDLKTATEEYKKTLDKDFFVEESK